VVAKYDQLLNMDNLLVYSLIGLGFGVFLFFRAFGWLKSKRLIENIPTSKIRSIAMGLVEVYGKVVPFRGEVLKSPFTVRDCVYSRFSIEEYRSSGKHSRWVTVRKGVDFIPFYIEDETGSVLVDPKGAGVEILRDNEFKSGFMKDPPEDVKRFLRRSGMDFEGFFSVNKTMRYRESFIEPGDMLYVMGTAGDNPFVEEGTVEGGAQDIMIGRGKERFFYISDRPEKRVLGLLRWKVIGGFFGGGLLILLCLWLVLFYSHFWSFAKF